MEGRPENIRNTELLNRILAVYVLSRHLTQ